MSLISRNPATTEILATFPKLSEEEVGECLKASHKAYRSWRATSFAERKRLMLHVAVILREKRHKFGRLISLEMGCPLDQAVTEIEKCAAIAEHYAHEAENYLRPETKNIGADEAFIAFDPLGPVLHVAPWNYPFYLALRPVIPAIMAGNAVVLKHASNVPQCSLALAEVFAEAEFPDGVFQSLLVSSEQVSSIIGSEEIAMVSVIASERAGSQIASQAGALIKKTVLELGGSDPFIVLDDANLDKVIPAAVTSRLRNCGQSCNAAKRFIVMESVVDEFTHRLKEAFESKTLGDPLSTPVDMGPLATEGSLIEIERQVQKSISLGARLITGGKRPTNLPGFYYPPTILTRVTPEMPVFSEEVFGPVAPIITVRTVNEAVELANHSTLGLGASIWSKNTSRARSLVSELQAGNVYVNEVVRGNPQLPYGGIKRSGYGREFGEYGIKEFVNIKSVVIQS